MFLDEWSNQVLRDFKSFIAAFELNTGLFIRNKT